MPTKGKILSEDSKEKMKQSKMNKLLSKYNWVIAEPYLDEVIDNGSTNRKNEYISLRQFKNNILSGISIRQMIDSGISNKIIQFFSNFCQGKISLTKEDFVLSYEKGESLEEISNKYKVAREDLTYLRQLYGIKRKGATYINRKKTEEKITNRQKEIIYGCLMGDGKRQTSNSFSSLSICQCNKQKEYSFWKYIELQNLVSLRGFTYTPPSYDGREEYKNSTGSWGFYTKANTDIEEINKEFYYSGRKRINKQILSQLSPLSIAVWFQDDGGGDMGKRIREKHPSWNVSPEFYFCTDSFSKEECDMIVEWFKEFYNIDTYLRFRKNGSNGDPQYRVVVRKTSACDFINLISSYILPCMKYKIDYNYYLLKINNK